MRAADTAIRRQSLVKSSVNLSLLTFTCSVSVIEYIVLFVRPTTRIKIPYCQNMRAYCNIDCDLGSFHNLGIDCDRFFHGTN